MVFLIHNELRCTVNHTSDLKSCTNHHSVKLHAWISVTQVFCCSLEDGKQKPKRYSLSEQFMEFMVKVLDNPDRGVTMTLGDGEGGDPIILPSELNSDGPSFNQLCYWAIKAYEEHVITKESCLILYSEAFRRRTRYCPLWYVTEHVGDRH